MLRGRPEWPIDGFDPYPARSPKPWQRSTLESAGSSGRWCAIEKMKARNLVKKSQCCSSAEIGGAVGDRSVAAAACAVVEVEAGAIDGRAAFGCAGSRRAVVAAERQ